HLRVGFDRTLELGLGLGILAAVPEDDALVVKRFGARARAARGAAGELRRLGAGRGGQVEFLLGVVNRRETVVRLGGVGLELDRLLVRRLGFRPLLLLGIGKADVVIAVGAIRHQTGSFGELG